MAQQPDGASCPAFVGQRPGADRRRVASPLPPPAGRLALPRPCVVPAVRSQPPLFKVLLFSTVVLNFAHACQNGKSELTYAAIVDAALDLAAAQGLESLSLGQVAKHLGISKSGVFSRVGSRERCCKPCWMNMTAASSPPCSPRRWNSLAACRA